MVVWFFIGNISIHTLALRVTANRIPAARRLRNFNPHPRTEGDSFHTMDSSQSADFNPHPRTEGDIPPISIP